MSKDDLRELNKQYEEICQAFDNDLTREERQDIKDQIYGVNYHLELNDILKGIE